MLSGDASEHSLSVSTTWLVVGKSLGFACTIAVPALLVRKMPQHEFGLYKQVFLALNSAVTMLPFGFGLTAFYFLPREPERRAHTVWNIVLFTAVVSACCAIVLCLFPQVLVRLFNEPQAIRLAPSLAAVVVLWVVGSSLEMVIVANNEIRLATTAILAVQFSRGALFLVAAVAGGTVGAVLVAATLQGVLQVAALLAYLTNRFPAFWRAFDLTFLRRQLTYALPLGVAGFLYSLQTDLHNYVVSHELGATTYAVYSIGCFQLPLFGILAESVGAVMIPRISLLQHQQQTREIVLLTGRAIRKLSLVYFGIYAFLMVVRREFIVALFTTRYLASVPVFAVNLTLVPLGILLLDPIMRGYSEHRLFPMKVYAVILIGLFGTLPRVIERFGLVGAILVVVACAVAGRAAMLLKVIDILNLRPSDAGILVDVAKAALAAAVAAVVTSVVRQLLQPFPALSIVLICGAVFGLAYVAAIVLLGTLAAEERSLILRFVRGGVGGGLVETYGGISWRDKRRGCS